MVSPVNLALSLICASAVTYPFISGVRTRTSSKGSLQQKRNDLRRFDIPTAIHALRKFITCKSKIGHLKRTSSQKSFPSSFTEIPNNHEIKKEQKWCARVKRRIQKYNTNAHGISDHAVKSRIQRTSAKYKTSFTKTTVSRYQMMTSWHGNALRHVWREIPITGGFPQKISITRGFDIYFDGIPRNPLQK